MCARYVVRSIVPAIVLAIIAAPHVASAHQSSIKYVTLAIDGSRVGVTVKLAPGDVAEAMGLAPDAKPAPAAAAAAPRVPGYVARWVVIAAGEPCVPDAPIARVAPDNFVEVAWTVTCERGDALVLDFAALFALDKRMEVIVRYGLADDDVVVVRAADSPVTLQLPQSAPVLRGMLRALPSAWFLIGLVLFALAEPAQRKRESKLSLAAFVLAFVAAFSIAATGIVIVAPRLVELFAAGSAVVLAIENVARAERARLGVAVLGGATQGAWLGARAPGGATAEYAFGIALVGAIALAIALYTLQFQIGKVAIWIGAAVLCATAAVQLAGM